MEKTVINLDKKVCLICTHLVGELGRKTKSCTAKKGNTKCPAQFFSIGVGVDTDTVLDNMYTAIQTKDIDTLQNLLDEARSNPKVVDAIFTDLSERLFEFVPSEEVAKDEEETETAEDGTETNSSSDEDEDDDA
jgi:hypothetical protein